MGCFVWLLLLAGGLFVLLSLVRWFEQVTEAVDNRWWNKVMLLIAFPFAAWLFPSRVSAGRPTAVPRHEPARGFGVGPTRSVTTPVAPTDQSIPIAKTASGEAAARNDQGPPPGTPPEFIGLPKIPPKKPKAPLDPEKIAKLRQKMKEQGMLDDRE